MGQQQIGIGCLCAVAAFVVIWLTWELLDTRRKRAQR